MKHWLCRIVLLGLMLAAAIPVARHAALTNDGPVHVAFANLMATMRQPGHLLQQQAYTLSWRPTPNLAVYLVMDVLIRISSPAAAESIVQVLCLIAPMAACWFALAMIAPKNVFLAVFVLPLSLNQMFFLGLYNHCIATAAFFLAIGVYFWMIKAPSAWRALALGACVALAFLCHASGFIMTFASIATLSSASFVLSLRRRERTVAQALKAQLYAVAALLGSLPLVALLLLSAGKRSNTAYGVGVFSRLKQFLSLQLLAVNLPRDAYVAQVVAILLLLAMAIVGVRIVWRRSKMSPERRDQALSALAAAIVSGIVMMAFPDSMGGGWTHFRRFETFPYLWGLLLLAFDSFSLPVIVGMTAAGASAGVFLLTSMIGRQAISRGQMAPLAQVDRAVGSHCTVLPLVWEKYPVDAAGNPISMKYSPYFQAASRLELTGDRVVLFNFLARLDVYPVHFKPEVEPQEHLFHWRPMQEQDGHRDRRRRWLRACFTIEGRLHSALG